MSFVQFLKDYNQELQPFLERFFEKEEQLAAKISSCSLQQLKILRNFLEGGKRSRGALMVLGYEIAGGKNRFEILKTSLAIEIMHAALLIHDDIMDRDDLRRGKPTVHRQFEEIHRKSFQKGEALHFGISMAIDEGLLAIFMALGILAESRFKPSLKEKVFKIWSNLLLQTGYGQGLDVTLENQAEAKDEEILTIHRLKTAFYTIVVPFQVGAVLANAPDNILKAMAGFGENVGIAFQLRDDELGIFSDQEELGKPIGSDIREGKNTILRSKALEFTTGQEKEFIKKTYGKKDLTLEEIEEVKRITVSCGALNYSQKMSQSLVVKGKKFIPQIAKTKEYQGVLGDLADFMIKRQR